MSEDSARHGTKACEGNAAHDHPPSVHRLLVTFYGAILCERFCFFLLIANLVLFLNERCGYTATAAVRAYGLFLSVCYLTPLVGGRLCDGILGLSRTTLLGVMVQFAGLLLLTFHSARMIPLALLLISFGSGLFKAGTQTLLASLPVRTETERNRLFSTVYVVVNVAALIAPLVAGLVQRDGQYAQWFALMLIFALCGIAALLPLRAASTIHRQRQNAETELPYPTKKRNARMALILLAGALFAAAFVQSHSTLLLFVRDHVARQVGRFTIPVAWFAAAPGAMVLLVSPLLATVLLFLRRRNREPSTSQKLALGMIITALAFLPICMAFYEAKMHHLASPAWVLSCFTLLAIGEILVGGLAPAEIARIAPADHRGRWMSYWFVATAIGNATGGWVEW